MRTFHELVFDDRVEGDTPVYTDPTLNARLAQPDVLEIVAIATQVSGSLPLLNVQVEVSSDDRNWTAKSGSSEIARFELSTSQQTMTEGRSSSSDVTSTFNRLKIWLDNSDSKARLRIYVTGRGEQAL